MVKKVKYTYRGMNQDVSKSKHPFQFYYEANNIRIVTTDTQSTSSIANEKGNELILDLPTVCIDVDTHTITYGDKTLQYNNDEIDEQINDTSSIECEETNTLSTCSETQQIIGYSLSRNSIILFSTDNMGFDCVWEVEEVLIDQYELKLLYCRNLGFSINNPIQTIFNYENDIIQKVYWVDGLNQLRFLNIKHSIENGDLEELIDVNSTNINIAGEYSLSQPEIVQVTNGGSHTSGMIQYAFNLYKLNGSQTTISPLSSLVSLDFGSSLGGGDINEITGSSPLVRVNNIDERYTHIKLYAIKYTSFNETPSVSVIVDQEIDNYNQFTYFDTGTIIDSISLSEFLFLGSNPFIPKHIETKDNRMFASNIEDKIYDFEIDGRAYAHTESPVTSKIWKNVTVQEIEDPMTGDITFVPSGVEQDVLAVNYNIGLKDDSINPDYNLYKYQSDGITLGGEGKYIKYEIVQKTEDQLEGSLKYTQLLKDNEIYRIAIEFFNQLGQKSFPIWIADFKTPEGNLEGNYNTLKIELKPEFYTQLDELCLRDDEKPIGYRVLRADRSANDKTILCQGSLSGMMVQTTNDVRNHNRWKDGDPFGQSPVRQEESLDKVKLPLLTSRSFQGNTSGAYDIFPVFKYGHLRMLNEGAGETEQEIYRDDARDYKRQQTWQYLKMMQLHTPDVLFNTGLSFSPTNLIKVRGAFKRQQSSVWSKVKNIDSGNETSDYIINNTTNLIHGSNNSMYGPVNDDEDDRGVDVRFLYMKNSYSDFLKNNIIEYPIYRSPEITERGQGTTSYGGDSNYKYKNSLENLLSDRYRRKGQSKKDEAAQISANCFGARCLTLVHGTDNMSESDRLSLDDFYKNSGISDNNILLIGEIVLPSWYVYSGNIYGGNTYEAKTRTSYIEIGNYNPISISSIQIDSPGDTFVQTFNFGRLLKTDVERFSSNVQQISEVIEFPIETSINLENRNDKSLLGWDNKFQPRYDEYHQYNRVYSQQPTLIQNQDVSFKFKKVNSFDTRVISSKLKIPGETIDNFTDFLEDEIIDLDGKYGAINAMVNYRDEIYTLQDEGIAHLIINPRAQVQATDGLALELGKGGILYDHQYLTTTSGTINKWSVYDSPSGFYYLDALNKSWNKFQGGQGIIGLSDLNGLHAYFENSIDYGSLLLDNPLLKQGASGGFDFINNNAYLTVHQKDKSFTLNYNEYTKSFESFHDYKPSIYINKGHKMFTTSPDLNKVYEHDKGEYQKFYEKTYPSYIILQVNPEADLDCVFNNIEYKSEMYLNDLDQPQRTLSHIEAWNEYQHTNRIPLVLGRNKNLRRKFRNWQANIPRQAGSRDRIRNPWIYLKLELDQKDNLKMILHDIIIHYTV